MITYKKTDDYPLFNIYGIYGNNGRIGATIQLFKTTNIAYFIPEKAQTFSIKEMDEISKIMKKIEVNHGKSQFQR